MVNLKFLQTFSQILRVDLHTYPSIFNNKTCPNIGPKLLQPPVGHIHPLGLRLIKRRRRAKVINLLRFPPSTVGPVEVGWLGRGRGQHACRSTPSPNLPPKSWRKKSQETWWNLDEEDFTTEFSDDSYPTMIYNHILSHFRSEVPDWGRLICYSFKIWIF